MPRYRFGVAFVALVFLAGACTSSDEGAEGDPIGADADAPALSADAGSAEFATAGAATQLTVTGAKPDVELALYDGDQPVDVGTTDASGALIFREVDPGKYQVGTTEGDKVASELTDIPTIDGSIPDQGFYDSAEIDSGYQYLTMRDGTQLAASVYLPGPVEDGPYPTVIEYSGYNPAEPGNDLLGENTDALDELGLTAESLCETIPWLCDSPAQPGSMIARAMDYAVVAVNVRGTGCSGGAYDYFDVPQLLDGYDVVETVAAQPWVKHGKVGMVGLSYPGISQLFVAQLQPPGLAAITAQSVMDDTVRGLLAPGGIYNQGFALSWADEVVTKAEPLGQGWEEALIEDGDEVCAENQKLRGQNVDVVDKALGFTHYPKELGDYYNPSLFAEDIEVPVLLTGALGDEQTGPRFPHLLDKFTNAPVSKMGIWNGVHADGFSPHGLADLKMFLDLYVDQEVPTDSPVLGLLAPVLFEDTFATEGLTIPPVRFSDSASLEEARAAYEAEPDVRVVWQAGGDPEFPGAPVGTNTYFLDSWPAPDVMPTAFYLGDEGTMSSTAATGSDVSASSFDFDPELAEEVNLVEGENIFHADAEFDWKQEPDGSAVAFVSEPLEADLVLFGPGSADLWIRSSTPEADIGVTLSEVRPDGKETWIQSGLLRSTLRKTADTATELWPSHNGYAEDAEDMPSDEFSEVRVEIMPMSHVIRAGSRVRLSVHTPGGDRPRWSYIISEGQEGGVFDVGHFSAAPSRVVLPETGLITGYPAELPSCPGLRGQPCRDFVEYVNRPAS